MTLSKIELDYIKAERSHYSSRDVINLLSKYGFYYSKNRVIHPCNERRVVLHLIEPYSKDCSIKIEDILPTTAEKFNTSSDKTLQYLKQQLLSTEDFGQNINANREILLGINKETYIDNPNMFLQRLAYFNCIHNSDISYKLSSIFGITDTQSLFYIMSETTMLLSLYPILKKEKKKTSLYNVLSYRLGLPVEEIKNSLNMDFSKIRPVSMSKKHFQNYNGKTVFYICVLITEQHTYQLYNI